MGLIRRIDLTALIVTSAIAVAGCALEQQAEPGTEEEPPQGEWRDSQAKALTDGFTTLNGLTSMNGLTSTNGLMALNGLSTTNGLKVINGLKVLNGMSTRNGLKVINGLSVDCVGKTVGKTCTGNPDGLFNKTTGVMKNAQGVIFATYLTRCALRPDQSIRVMRWDKTLVTLTGEIGLAPEWLSGNASNANGLCDSNCQERVSACLMALSNASGDHVSIGLTSTTQAQIGADPPSTHPYIEGYYYGNVFDSPPRFYVHVGRAYPYNRGMVRSCMSTVTQQQWSDPNIGCPFLQGRGCDAVGGDFTVDATADYCYSDTDGDPGTFSDLKYWNNPLTVWRSVPSEAPTFTMYVKGDMNLTPTLVQ